MSESRVEYAHEGGAVVYRRGIRYAVKAVGLGHPWHTITTEGDDSPRGRVATDAEIAFAEALAGIAQPAHEAEKEEDTNPDVSLPSGNDGKERA